PILLRQQATIPLPIRRHTSKASALRLTSVTALSKAAFLIRLSLPVILSLMKSPPTASPLAQHTAAMATTPILAGMQAHTTRVTALY
ncbi:hypothetical protein LJC63_02955, partial [Ruminococcaceae bacterium OttesenSCG-928-L11]|nr:hypothetical protein [Ruminococcaceae bacterium OttesenSCG-928-L11]